MSPVRSHRHPLAPVVVMLSSRGALLLLGVAALGVSVFAGVDAFQQRPNDGSIWLLGRPEIIVLESPPRADGVESPLRAGDQIIGIAGMIVASPQEAAAVLRRQQVGSEVPYLIRRDGRDVIVPVPLTGFRVGDRFYIYYILIAFVYLAIGTFVLLKSGNDRPARLFFLLCLLFTVFFMTNLSRSSYFWGDIITQNAGALARFLLPALFLNFFLVFPEKKFFLTRHPYTETLLYLLPAMFYVQFTLDQFFGSRGPRIGTTRWLILGCYFAAGVVAVLHSYLRYRDPLQRQRVRTVTIGTVAGVLPFLVFKIGFEEIVANSDLALLGVAPLAAIPAAFGYSIARYRVMQVDLLLKRSLVYTLLTVGLVAVYLLVVLGLGGMVLQLSRQTGPLVSVGATLVIAALLWPARARLQQHLDRRFFRSRTNLAAALQEFSREIPRLIQRDALLDRVGGRICRLLDLPCLGVYLRDESAGPVRWRLAARISPEAETRPTAATVAAVGVEGHAAWGKHFPAELALEATAQRLERSNEPLWVEGSGPRRPELGPAVTRELEELAQRLDEQEHLARAGVALLVPLVLQGRLVGMFAMPAKRSGDDFEVQDLDLLTIVAGQVALQVENSRLYEEEIEKRKLEEQLALARTIQSRLLPGRIPEVRGAELSAINICSAQVSGDYYDLIPRPDGRVALVISDVSGKGVPASLLASSLQAALRAQFDSTEAPGLILERVNRQLHASTDPQHFATLFLGLYDPATRTLRYSSGGHNPPILRRGDGAVQLLEEGGLPLGAFDFGGYAEGMVSLAPGDLLLLYTDGLTETLGPDGEEFGTERVERILHEHHQLPAAQLITRLGDELERFSGRRQADDDVTLVALKITAGEQRDAGTASGLAAAGAAPSANAGGPP